MWREDVVGTGATLETQSLYLPAVGSTLLNAVQCAIGQRGEQQYV